MVGNCNFVLLSFDARRFIQLRKHNSKSRTKPSVKNSPKFYVTRQPPYNVIFTRYRRDWAINHDNIKTTVYRVCNRALTIIYKNVVGVQ